MHEQVIIGIWCTHCDRKYLNWCTPFGPYSQCVHFMKSNKLPNNDCPFSRKKHGTHTISVMPNVGFTLCPRYFSIMKMIKDYQKAYLFISIKCRRPWKNGTGAIFSMLNPRPITASKWPDTDFIIPLISYLFALQKIKLNNN